jgi:dolichol-phosphate mannosyltransferase
MDQLEKPWSNYEILVIDTQKPLDSTAEVCLAYDVQHIHRRGGNRFGDAIRTGIEEAQGDWILFMDADGSHGPEFIQRLVSRTKESDIVIASRYVDGGFTENGRVLVAMSWILNVTYRWVLGLRCKDVSNSFKLYRASYLKELRLKCHNFDIIEEILFKISRNHPEARMEEVPFSFKKRLFGETKRNLFAFIFSYFFTMVRLRLSIYW